MRTIEENKMVTIEAGDSSVMNACVTCFAYLAAITATWEAALYVFLNPSLYSYLSPAAAGACITCLLGMSGE